MATPPLQRGRRLVLPVLTVAFLATWVLGTTGAILGSGPRGADSEAALLDRAATALRAGDGAAFDEVLLDAADRGFADDYVSRLRAAGTPELLVTGPGMAQVRAGTVRTTLSVARQDDRWYLSLLPPEQG